MQPCHGSGNIIARRPLKLLFLSVFFLQYKSKFQCMATKPTTTMFKFVDVMIKKDEITI